MAQRIIRGQVARPIEPGETAVYRFFDSDGRLLYVGMSNQPIRRWYSHTERPWWRCASMYEITWYDTGEDAAAAEMLAIRSENPLHNIHCTPRHGEVTGCGVRAALAREAARQAAIAQN